jgi:hypothetical protein
MDFMKKSAITILLNNTDEDKRDFRSCLSLLIENYLKEFPCDIVCFYEKDFCQTEMDFLKSNFEVNLIFEPIEFTVPEYPEEIISQIPQYFPHPEDPNHIGFSMGYRHMCRFFAGEIFHHPILKEYKYIWRLDTDSKILSKITYNVFDQMQHSEAVYGYVNIQHDHPAVIQDLWSISEKYFQSIGKGHIFNPDVFHDHFRRVFYTNFEILDLDFFRGKEYQSFYKHLDNTGGIYKYRWGDHIIRYIALKSLVDNNKLLFFNDIVYQHGNIYHNTEIINTY